MYYSDIFITEFIEQMARKYKIFVLFTYLKRLDIM